MNNNLGKTVLSRMNRRILAVHQLVLATTAPLLLALFAVKAQSETPGKMDAKQHFDPIVRKIEGWKVHITWAASLLDRHQLAKHHSVILHDLSHAAHGQILGGYEERRILAAYKKAMKAGLYDKVLAHTGHKVRAYATTPMAYFAEGAEAYFDRNDFYPFVRAELKEHDPGLYDLLEEIWGVKT